MDRRITQAYRNSWMVFVTIVAALVWVVLVAGPFMIVFMTFAGHNPEQIDGGDAGLFLYFGGSWWWLLVALGYFITIPMAKAVAYTFNLDELT